MSFLPPLAGFDFIHGAIDLFSAILLPHRKLSPHVKLIATSILSFLNTCSGQEAAARHSRTMTPYVCYPKFGINFGLQSFAIFK